MPNYTRRTLFRNIAFHFPIQRQAGRQRERQAKQAADEMRKAREKNSTISSSLPFFNPLNSKMCSRGGRDTKEPGVAARISTVEGNLFVYEAANRKEKKFCSRKTKIALRKQQNINNGSIMSRLENVETRFRIWGLIIINESCLSYGLFSILDTFVRSVLLSNHLAFSRSLSSPKLSENGNSRFGIENVRNVFASRKDRSACGYVF